MANYFKTFKIGVGAAVSIIIADMLGLSFGTAAGIITLLSVQNTKKDTLRIAARRILAFGIAIILAKIVFYFLGYTAVSFGLFLFGFVIICEIWNLQEGISLCAVLVTHFLIWEHMTAPDIWNEFLLLVIGILVGAATNLYIPRNVKEIKRCQSYIELKMKEILNNLSKQLLNFERKEKMIEIEELHLYIQKAVRMAYENSNNTFLADTQYFIAYMELRLAQLTVLERMCILVKRINSYDLSQAEALANFLNQVAAHLRENNNGETLFLELEQLKDYYERDSLPTNRTEFENRAILYQIVCEMEWFLQLKIQFSRNLTAKQIREFWEK